MKVRLLKQSVCQLGVFPVSSTPDIPEELASQWIRDGVAEAVSPGRSSIEANGPAPKPGQPTTEGPVTEPEEEHAQAAEGPALKPGQPTTEGPVTEPEEEHAQAAEEPALKPGQPTTEEKRPRRRKA